MHSLSENQLLTTLLAIAVILLAARSAGEVARRLRQPEVLGELFAGFVLGPSVLGAFFPNLRNMLFLNNGADLVLSGFSWVGAILLLLIAGLEVDLDILRAEARPGLFAAAGAIIPSLLLGIVLGASVLGMPALNSFFLGIVLSVTAVSVAAKVLMEREELRRRFAQVILAAGIAGEVLAWLLISVVSAGQHGSPVLAALRSGAFAIAFFVFMLTLGRRFTFWIMRRVADQTQIVKGQLSLVLVLTFVAAAITEFLGLHALLGAFVFGVLLSRAPRSSSGVTESIQTITVGFFAPVFFVLAGMRVDLLQLRTLSAIGTIVIVLVVVTISKVTVSALGARLGGMRSLESVLIGVGLNLKGGTDVIVAILGVELGLLSERVYTIYAVVAMLTVLFSPILLDQLAKRTPPTADEQARLDREQAEQRAYVSQVERVLVPVATSLLPNLTTDVLECMANAKLDQGQAFDITEYVVDTQTADLFPLAKKARSDLNTVNQLENVEVTERHVDYPNAVTSILTAAQEHDLLVLGTRPRRQRGHFTYGRLQDTLLSEAHSDIMLIASPQERITCAGLQRILVPTNGLGYASAAGDLAAYLAKGVDAEIVLLHVLTATMDTLFWHERSPATLRAQAEGSIDELAAHFAQLGVRVTRQIRVSQDQGAEITRELIRQPYQMIVMGAVNRGNRHHPYLGKTVEDVLTKSQTPALVLVAQSVG